MKIALFLSLIWAGSSFASNFQAGQVISAEELNDSFQSVSSQLQSRGFVYSFESLTEGEKISVETLNDNFNNFKALDPLINILSLIPGEMIKASKLNQNFQNINQSIQDKFSQRTCSVDNGSGTQSFNIATNQWNSTCNVSSCINSSFHIESNQCLANIQSCSTSLGSGIKTWQGASYSACALSSCISNYHLQSGECVSNVQSCTISGGTGTQTWTGSAYSTCAVASCSEGFHQEANACIANVQSCPISNGTGSKTWNTVSSSYSSCVLVACNEASGWYPSQDNSSCINTNSIACTNQVDSQGNTIGYGTYNYSAGSWSSCQTTSCVSGYTLSSGSCSCSGDSCLISATEVNSKFNELQDSLRDKTQYIGFTTLSSGQPVSASTLNTNFNSVKTFDPSHFIVSYGTSEAVSIARFNLNFNEAKRIVSEKLFYKNCAEIKYFLPASTSKAYVIDPDGFGSNPEFTAYCDMSEIEGQTVVMKLAAADFPYGNAKWNDSSAYNETHSYSDNPLYPSNDIDSKNRSFFRFDRSYKLRFDSRVNGVIKNKLDFIFSGQNSPKNLMLTTTNPITSMPTYANWINVFGHDRTSNPVFERNGSRTRGLIGCGKPMVFGWQANDAQNDTNSGIGQNVVYCGGGANPSGGGFNFSVSGNYSNKAANSPKVIILETSRVWALPTSCNDAKLRKFRNQAGNHGDGVYILDTDGANFGLAPFSAYCDMTTDGGGWTLVLEGKGFLAPGGNEIYSADSKTHTCLVDSAVNCPDTVLYWQTKSIVGTSYLKKINTAPTLVARFNQSLSWETMAGIKVGDSRLINTYLTSNPTVFFNGYAGDSSGTTGCQDSAVVYTYLFPHSTGNSACGGTHSLLYSGPDGGFLYNATNSLEGQIFVR